MVTAAGGATLAARKASRLAAEASAHGREPQPAEPALAALAGCRLDRTGDHGLAGGAAAGLAGLRTADQGLVGLDPVRQRPAAPGRTIALRILCSQDQAVW